MFFSKPIDPVCGMKVNKDTSYKSDYKNKMVPMKIQIIFTVDSFLAK